MKKFSKIIVYFCIFIFLVSCTKKNTNKIEKNLEKQKSEISTVIENMDYEINPSVSSNINSDAMLSQVFEGLTEYDKDGKIQLNQAREVKPNDDYTVWNIKIKDNLKWSNGERLTVDDYVDSWNSILHLKNSNQNFYRLFVIKNAKGYYENFYKNPSYEETNPLGIVKKNDYEMEIHLEQPMKNFDEFLSNVFMFPYRENLYNSAYKIESISKEKIVLVKNEYYDRKNDVEIEKINLLLNTDDIMSYQLFDLQQVDFVGLPFFEIPYERRLDANKKPEFISFKTNIMEFLEFNKDSKFFENKELKKSIYQLIDSKFLANIILYNDSIPFFENAKLTLKEKEDLKKFFENEKEKPIINIADNGTKLNERIVASISKEFISNLNIKANITSSEYDLKYSRFNSGTTDNNDIKYYINNKFQDDDINKMYNNLENFTNDYFIFPLYNRSFSVLAHKNIKNIKVLPNGHLLIKDIKKLP